VTESIITYGISSTSFNIEFCTLTPTTILVEEYPLQLLHVEKSRMDMEYQALHLTSNFAHNTYNQTERERDIPFHYRDGST
jgi:hypothetical protein